MPHRREIQPFSLSFLDAIACGFGAILLLLVITKVTQPMVLEQTTEALRTEAQELEDRLDELRSLIVTVDTEAEDRRDQVSRRRGELARLSDRLSSLRGEFEMSEKDSTVVEILERRLEFARAELTQEVDELRIFDAEPSSVIGGIPADSEYIIFIIDTSSSMFQYAWPAVQRKVSETLAVYPDVKGIQVMNDMGQYMFPRYRGRWIPDSRARRKAIVDKLRGWRAFSNSSPVEGITRAISTFYSSDKRISLYVFGDEFTGGGIQPVLDAVNKINRFGTDGNRLVRIHAVGFPVMLEQDPRLHITGERFATLMRLLCEQHGGTFIALNSAR
ncbi:MAG: VWA domain-containing protein [Gammaproteobacteria bacterium]|nr:VWA domain-containing protein [Gammaproteobacteria bacterium]NNF59921.1 VWA domain-containing protein [Gammaproteobacteria bacterium]NNM21655.1 VWA domain-containing protein [Gammaproteobacteria bacterium]